MKFRLKYYEGIKAAALGDANAWQAATPFDINVLGADTFIRRAKTWLRDKAIRIALATFREVWPNPQFGRLIIVTRDSDVREVLNSSKDFEVPYGPEMEVLAGGQNFALGMDDCPHKRQNGIIRQVVRDTDADEIATQSAKVAQILLDASGGRIDVMKDLIVRVATETCSRYFGLQIDDPDAFADWAMAVSALLFADPTGNDETRRLALRGAARMRDVIDRAIAGAQTNSSSNDTVIGRLVELHKADPSLTTCEIRAIMVGLVIGFIPTNTLGAGKILEELLRRPEEMEAAQAMARAKNREGLRAILLEALRLNPALSPGQWRYARGHDAVIAARTWRPKRVRVNSVLMVATASALRDRRKFKRPGQFRPGRQPKPDLMFGAGPHWCVGTHQAMAQITEIFLILFSQKNLRRAPKKAGRLAWIGPFPYHLNMEFEPTGAPAEQTMVTVWAPVRPDADLLELRTKIGALGNPAEPIIAETLEDSGIVHFASLSLIEAGDDDKPAPHILLELSLDGPQDRAIDEVAKYAQGWLEPIFDQADAGAGNLADRLKRAALDLRTRPWGAIGLNFAGTQDFPVADIVKQEALAKFAEEVLAFYLQNHGVGGRAMPALDHVRSFIRNDDRLVQYAKNNPAQRSRVEKLLTDGAAFRNDLIRPGGRRLPIAEWVASGRRSGFGAVLWSKASRTILLTVGLFAALMSALILHATGLAPATEGAGMAGFLWAVARVLLALLAGILAIVGSLAAAIGILLALREMAEAAGSDRDSGSRAARRPKTPRKSLLAPGILLVLGLLLVLASAFIVHAMGLTPSAGGADIIGVLWIVGRVLLALAGGVLATLGLLAALAGIFLLLLWYHEKKDRPDDQDPRVEDIETIAASENHAGYLQNHITAVTPLKNGWFRKFTLAAALWGIKQLVRSYRPGFVLNMGTIHYAKWFRPPGSEKLIFLSNYDGSWESYLEDFIMKAHKGQTAAWSNGVGFPRTRWLIFGGAQDGDRFKRWVRRQQVVSQFWYSRFPHLTTDQIRRNALIHDGLAHATTDTAAQAWLECFGSMPRPEYAIETEEVQSLVFDGLPYFKYCTCVVLQLPDMPIERKAWLSSIVQQAPLQAGPPRAAPGLDPIAFGDHRFDRAATATTTFVAFSAAGLRKLGLSGPNDLATFPSAFSIGMANRSRLLGDEADSAPQNWCWADADRNERSARVAEAVLLVYAKTPEQCEAAADAHVRLLGGEKRAVVHRVATAPIKDKDNKDRLDYEHFKFRDGISQPVIRGTQRFAKGTLARDIVEPGEFILGYRNNQKYFPPTPLVRPEADPKKILPSPPAATPSRFPSFRTNPESDARDLGRNGTFLVIRQLAQDVAGFETFTSDKAKELQQYPALADAGGSITADWVAAKMMGRWQDGTPLIDRRRPAARAARMGDLVAYNDFNFGVDDPQGLRCPFGAHIRRVNPRDSLQPDDPAQPAITNRHRLLRRGRTYEAQLPGEREPEKGLLFMCVCADLERQFEFVQQTWIGSPSFHGLQDEPDPIAGQANPSLKKRVFTIPTPSGPVAVKDMESFITVRAGGYFFLPSRSAIEYLIELN